MQACLVYIFINPLAIFGAYNIIFVSFQLLSYLLIELKLISKLIWDELKAC